MSLAVNLNFSHVFPLIRILGGCIPPVLTFVSFVLGGKIEKIGLRGC
jgi:hypothetical protein